MSSDEAAVLERQVRRAAVVAKCEHVHRLVRLGFIRPHRRRPIVLKNWRRIKW